MTNPIMLEGPAQPFLNIQPSRISPQQLADIKTRVQRGLNAESAAILYPQDVVALLNECMALEQGVWSSDEMQRLREIAAQSQSSLASQQAEMGRLRGEAIEAKAALTEQQEELNARLAKLQAQVTSLERQNVGLRDEVRQERQKYTTRQKALWTELTQFRASMDRMAASIDG